jgi:formate dehydrogenase major subunit
MLTEFVPTDERTGPRFPLLLTTGRILSQYNVGAQTRRTANVAWHDEDVLEIHPHDAENRGIRTGDLVAIHSPHRRHRPAARCGLSRRLRYP